MHGTCCYKSEVPDSPPNRLFSQTLRANTRAPVIELVRTDGAAVEQAFFKPRRSFDVPITHRRPLRGFKAQDVSYSAGTALSLQIRHPQPSQLNQ